MNTRDIPSQVLARARQHETEEVAMASRSHGQTHAEARRLHSLGFKLCELESMSKKPKGDAWNKNPIEGVRDAASGHGVILAANGLCSVDPDNLELAREGMTRCGFDLEAVMQAGVRTSSTRPGSGGRTTFRVPVGTTLAWVTFSSRTRGTLLELRATSDNLQDALPGTVYRSKDGSGPYHQAYANGRTLDEAGDPPPDLLAWWLRLSTDLEFLQGQQAVFCGHEALLSVSSGKQLAYPSSSRGEFNRHHDVIDILERHGYTEHGRGRWAPASASGAPAVREIRGKDGLWQSDHASDPLHGMFDAWTAYVQLDHDGNQAAAEGAWGQQRVAAIVADFDDLDAGATDLTEVEVERPAYKRDKNGNIPAELHNVKTALMHFEECGVRVAFDEFEGGIVIDGGQGWRPLTDGMRVALRELLGRRGFKAISNEMMRDSLLLVAECNHFDPAKQWLQAQQWDGVERIKHFVPRYLGGGDDEYAHAAGMYAWTAQAGRVLQPGCKADMMIILVGAQGTRKSSSVRAMAPHPDHYGTLNLSLNDADIARVLRRKLVVELDELAGMRGREVESLKSLVSRQTEDWTQKYQENNTRYPRRCMLVGTTNDREFLNDHTGARRFLPIQVQGMCEPTAIQRDRDQLWTEGAWWFEQFGVLHEDAERTAQGVHASFTAVDSWTESVQVWYSNGWLDDTPAQRPYGISVADALVGIGVPVSQHSPAMQSRMSKVLVTIGLARDNRWIGKKRPWRYYPPASG